MKLYDIGTIRVGSTLQCMCHQSQNVVAIGFWVQELCYLYKCKCNRIIVLSIIGEIVGIMKPKKGG